jgi:O-antigen/teichoic acid export membrane protein
MLIPAAGTLLYSAFRARTIAEQHSSPHAVVEDDRPVIRRELIQSVLPIGAGIVLSALYFRIDVLLIERWLGLGAVATYNAVFRLVEALRLFPAAVLAVTLPILCRAGTLRPLVRVASGVTAGALVATFALWIAAPWLVPFLYGAAYADGVTAFRILLLSFPFMSLNYALTHQLIGWHGHRAYAVICGTALIVNVALNAWAILRFGLSGAAWITLATEAVVFIGSATALMAVVRSANARGAAAGLSAEQAAVAPVTFATSKPA